MCLSGRLHMCTCVRVVYAGEGQRIMSGVFSQALSACCLRQGLPLDGNLSKFARKLASNSHGLASLSCPSCHH